MCGDCLIPITECALGYYLRRETKVTRKPIDSAQQGRKD